MPFFPVPNQSLRWLFAELVVVILGILIAFQVDGWNQARQEAALKNEFIVRLLEDLRVDVASIESRIRTVEQRLGFVKLLEESVHEPSAATRDPTQYIRALTEASYILTLSKRRFTFDEMINTGNLSLIEDSDIRQSLARYYDGFNLDESYRLYQAGIIGNFGGILTTDQVFLNGDRGELTFDEDAALKARENFIRRTEAVASLPILAEMQFTMRTLAFRLGEGANQLVEELQMYQDAE